MGKEDSIDESIWILEILINVCEFSNFGNRYISIY